MSAETDHHKINFQNILLNEIPKTITLLDKLIAERNIQIASWKEEDNKDLSKDALAIATGNLISIQDIFTALHKHIHKEDEFNYTLHTFPRSTNALVRLALENLAIYNWIGVEDPTRTTESKAYSFLLYNAEEGEKYYRALGDTRSMQRISEQLDQLIEVGFSRKYLSIDPKDKKPYLKSALAQIPNTTDLCQKIRTINAYSKESQDKILAMYPGIGNAAFLYKFFSGHVHGLQWVTKFEGAEGMPTKQEIIYWIPNMALLAIISYIKLI